MPHSLYTKNLSLFLAFDPRQVPCYAPSHRECAHKLLQHVSRPLLSPGVPLGTVREQNKPSLRRSFTEVQKKGPDDDDADSDDLYNDLEREALRLVEMRQSAPWGGQGGEEEEGGSEDGSDKELNEGEVDKMDKEVVQGEWERKCARVSLGASE